MNDFFGDNSEQSQSEESTQDENNIDSEEIEESDDTEGVEFASDESQEEYDEEESEPQDDDLEIQLKKKDEEIEKIKADSQKWVSSLQSSFDKQLAEMQGQMRQFMESQNHQHEQVNDEDSFLDEYGEEKELTASEVRRVMAIEEKKRQTVAEKQKSELERVRNQEMEVAKSWLNSQPDIDNVWGFYNKNLKSDPIISQLDYQAQYYYVKTKMSESSKKEPVKTKNKNKKRIPPTGNPNRNFSSRGVTSANSIMQALSDKRQEYGKAKGFFN
jgi:hypothetical protein